MKTKARGRAKAKKTVMSPKKDHTMAFLDRFDHTKVADLEMNFNPYDISVVADPDSKNIKGLQITFKFGGKKHTCAFVKRLGSGTYGAVYMLTVQVSGGHTFPIVLKIDKSDSEYLISEQLFNKCDTVQSKLLTIASVPEDDSPDASPSKVDMYMYFMQVADGDLVGYKADYLNHMSEEKASYEIKVICESIRKQLVCMLTNGLVYTDMKPANCLYKMVDGMPRFLVGDLGGAYCDSDNEHITTFPPPEYLNNPYPGYFEMKTMEDKKRVLSWNIGVMLFTLMPDVGQDGCGNKDYSYMYFKDPCPDKYNDLLRRAGRLLDERYGKGFGKYLSKDPRHRPNIKTSLLNLKKPKRKRCPNGFRRNKAGECVSNTLGKVCPPGKTLHPKTNRCRKDIMKKPCPPGKKRNPKTKRCRKTN